MYTLFQVNREIMHLVDTVHFELLREFLNENFEQKHTNESFFWEEKDVIINFEKRKGIIFLVLNWTGEGRESKNKYLKTNDKIKRIVEKTKEMTKIRNKNHNVFWC